MKKLLVAENIKKALGEGAERRNILEGVSIEMNEGEFISIMGPSGSGKSTLLYALSGMDPVDAGRVVFDGEDLSDCNEKELANIRRTKMGFIFQQPTLLKNLHILDNIILPASRDNRKKSDETIVKAKNLMMKTGISEIERRGITEASGGQLQRAGICRALMSDPKIIFGDEPTGALNSKSAIEIMDIFTEINGEGTGILLVTHDAHVAARGERVLFMRDGKVISELRFSKFDGRDLTERVNQVIEKMQEIGI